MQEHLFFHADRGRFLTEGQKITLAPNGFSKFGTVYEQAFRNKPPAQMSEPELRELMLETVRAEHSQFKVQRPSRLHCMFAALTVEDAKRFVAAFSEPSTTDVPIYEVFASQFWTLDMNWLDYQSDPATRRRNMDFYWYGEISNHNPPVGDRRAPMLEVLIGLPATIGKVVDWVRNGP